MTTPKSKLTTKQQAFLYSGFMLVVLAGMMIGSQLPFSAFSLVTVSAGVGFIAWLWATCVTRVRHFR